MKVSVNFINQTIILDVESLTTISDLKKKIYEKFRVLTSMQSIMFEGLEVRDDASTLSDNEMRENACIILTLKKHVASSFDRKALLVADQPTSMLKSEQWNENSIIKGHGNHVHLKSTRVRFDDSVSLGNTSLDEKQNYLNGNGILIDKIVDVNEINNPAVAAVDSIGTVSVGTPQKHASYKFEAKPAIENGIVVNEAYLTEDANKKKTADIPPSLHVDTVQEMKVILRIFSV